jgi:hypothetical protein
MVATVMIMPVTSTDAKNQRGARISMKILSDSRRTAYHYGARNADKNASGRSDWNGERSACRSKKRPAHAEARQQVSHQAEAGKQQARPSSIEWQSTARQWWRRM